MTVDVAGYLNIAIGLAGIVLTMLTSPALLGAFGRARLEELPTQSAGIGGAIRLFSVLFVLVCFSFLLCLGLAVTLASIAEALGAPRPMLTSSLAIGAVFSLAVTLLLFLYGKALWVPGFVGTFGLAVLCLSSAVSETLSGFWLIFGFFLMAFIITGIGGLSVEDDGELAKRIQSDWNRPG